MTELHARLDLLEGELRAELVGAAREISKRTFAMLTLTRGDGTAGIGEATPLPGYSSDSIERVVDELRALVPSPVQADPLATPFELLRRVFEAHPISCPAARFALETALLDWLGRNREEPLHRVLRGDAAPAPIPIADLVMEPNPARWPAKVDALIAEGATHLKLKVGVDIGKEVSSLETIRAAHPRVSIRLDGNRRVPLDALRNEAAALEALEIELFEEPVAARQWPAVLDLPLPFALDESLRDEDSARALLASGRIRAVVLKPTVLGGLRASLEWAERAAEHEVACLLSHTFDGPVARAASAELALALQTELAAGLGVHPGLALWPPSDTAAIAGRTIVAHDSPGLGLSFGGPDDD